jgi:hypothetical protein
MVKEKLVEARLGMLSPVLFADLSRSKGQSVSVCFRISSAKPNGWFDMRTPDEATDAQEETAFQSLPGIKVCTESVLPQLMAGTCKAEYRRVVG